MKLRIEPLTKEQIRTFLTWEYQEPYDIYNMSSEETEEAVNFFIDPQNSYFAIISEESELLGFCNFGADAQVPGGDYQGNEIDIGMGMRPDLTGLGHGRDYAAAVFSFAEQEYPGQRQRVTIAEFNNRAQRLCEHFGFKPVARFAREKDGRSFIIFVCDLQHDQEMA